MVVYLDEAWTNGRAKGTLTTIPELVAASLEAASKRVRPMLMTVLTNVFGLLPILLATGVGADVAKRIAAERRETKAAARQAAKAEQHKSREAALAAYRSEQARRKAERALLAKIRKRLRSTTKGAETRGISCELTEADVARLLAPGRRWFLGLCVALVLGPELG